MVKMRCGGHLVTCKMGVRLFCIIGIIFVSQSDAFNILSRDIPCEFLDSVNITDGIRQSNGSILFNGIQFPSDQYATINYIYENGTKRITVDPYTRGCLCNIKPCIRLCCPYGTFVNGKKCDSHESAREFESDVIDENNNVNKVILDHHFGYVADRPCSYFFRAKSYNITHTGDVWHDNSSVAHRRYCMRAMFNNATQKPILDVLMCFETEDDAETRYVILPYGMLLSVPFIVATFLVYICLPELRNLHGKCLLCYLFGLVIGYTEMALVQLNGANYVEPILCKSLGYTIYFSFLSAFLWLSVISFDLWWNFRSTTAFVMFSEKKRFFLYMLYAWGLSLFLTFIVFIIDTTKSLAEELQPGIGQKTCFLKKTAISQFLFFYMPLFIICTINIIFFVLTALKIRQVQQELKRVTSQEESSRHQNKLNHDKDNFTLYLRLFIVMGVTWSTEIISFFISQESNFFLLTDVCNTLQGVLIFVLFVMKRRVLKLIKKRWQICFGKATTNGSVATNSTSATYAPPNIAMNQITSPNDKSKGHC